MTFPLDPPPQDLMDRANAIQNIARSQYSEARILYDQAMRLTQDVKHAMQQAAALRERATVALRGALQAARSRPAPAMRDRR